MRIGLSALEMGRGDPGVREYVVALTRALLARDEPPDLVLFVLEEDLPQFEFASRRVELIAVPEQFRDSGRDQDWRENRLPELARERDLDVVHLSSYQRLQWRGSCPLVATVHDPTPLLDVRKKDWETGFIERIVGRKPKPLPPTFVATSEFTANRLQERLELPHGSVAVIPPGIDHERYRPGPAYEAKTALDARFDLKEPFFLCVARLDHPVGNHVGLIAAFNRFKRRARSSWMLMLVGEDGAGAEAVHSAIQQSPYASDIRLEAQMDATELPTLYQAADAFVYPSLHELPDLTVVEAMACGCPVISSTRGVLGEWVGEASSLIDPEDMDDFAGKLAAMAGSLELRQRWRAAGLAQARKFDWQQTAAETMAVYERVAPPA